MKGTILVTDSLFIFPEHIDMLRKAGYDVERLDTPTASEEQLIQAIKGKAGYILGGIEQVTDRVINEADQLKAIAFTGSDWKAFIPGYEAATNRGISIANTPGANSYAVAEYAVTLSLAMTRNVFELGRTGTKKFQTTRSLKDLTVGIIGVGHIGSIVATHMKLLGAKQVAYFSRTQKPEIESEGIEFMSKDKLLAESDIVFVLIPKSAGDNFLNAADIKNMKDGALLVNIASSSLVDMNALLAELQTGRLRAVQDDPVTPEFTKLPLSVWFNSNSHTAYNTFEANRTASDMAVASIINLLTKGTDTYKVN